MDVIRRMGMVATDKNDRPKNPIAIHECAAFQGPPPSGTLKEQAPRYAQFTSLA